MVLPKWQVAHFRLNIIMKIFSIESIVSPMMLLMSSLCSLTVLSNLVMWLHVQLEDIEMNKLMPWMLRQVEILNSMIMSIILLLEEKVLVILWEDEDLTLATCPLKLSRNSS